ncbi:MAG TPA: STAS domain-containing protein [Acidobacteriota bacterium]|nr:STAS domain-containing protein [Acidobacteriota bacterium]
MIAAARRADRAHEALPLFQWDPVREPGTRTLRLFGSLGDGELRRVLDAIVEQARGPREFLLIDFSDVEHVDFRAVPDFLAALGRWRDRSATIWLVGVTPYVRRLMDVSGQGALRRALSWDVGPGGNAARLEGDDLRSAERRALRAGVWN